VNKYIYAGKNYNHFLIRYKMLLGLRTAVYYVNDITAAKEWYTNALGFPPYFDEPFYVGFDVGGYELGLLPEQNNVRGKNQGAVPYWGVENAEQAYRKLLELGAESFEDVEDVGGGIKVATVLDPFGNIFGVIENPAFKIKE
jgi:predicted enzyme related to lactoylglutathione lyase